MGEVREPLLAWGGVEEGPAWAATAWRREVERSMFAFAGGAEGMEVVGRRYMLSIVGRRAGTVVSK